MKNFIQKNKAILLTVVITAIATSAVASGYFMIKNEKKSASQKVETLQKSIEELQAKNEAYQEVSEEPEADILVEETALISETTIQETPVTKKNVAVDTVEDEPKEEIVSCVAFDGTTLKVSEDECDEIRQKNVIVQKALDKYDDCISGAEDDLADAKEEYQDSMNDGYDPHIVSEYNQSIKDYNSIVDDCVNDRNGVIEKIK